mmetsp:Transcript_119/g.235  ORF Transcript_119/g.235 Transcript_119/m.235 type:complete len:91 (+) Transcript_119:512-784(+)
MIKIEQRLFEGKDNNFQIGLGPGHANLANPNHNKSVMGSDNSNLKISKSDASGQGQAFSKEVEKLFIKICQSIELYKTENIPIITEFLEF